MCTRVMRRSEVRAIDERAIREYGIPGMVLMENAGRGAAEILVELGIHGPVVICAGKGNNAGDGFVIARHLENRDYDVHVLLFCNPDDLAGDALTNYRIIETADTPIHLFANPPDIKLLNRRLNGSDWIVDALLGTGTQGKVREPFASVIAEINASGKKVLAIDLPSGMDCDSGQSLGSCIVANHTATFVARKAGFDCEGASQKTGTVHVVDIGVPRKLLRE